MVRSLLGKWKQSLFYDFDTFITTDLWNLMKIIVSVEASGFKVQGFVCDIGLKSHGLFSELYIKQEKTYFANTSCRETKVWAFFLMP